MMDFILIFFLKILTFLQRLPFIIFVIVTISFSYLFFLVFRNNKLLIFNTKFLIRIYFFLNGIHLKIDPKIKKIQGIIIADNNININSVILFLIFSKIILVMPEDFFLQNKKGYNLKNIINRVLFSNGFFPKESFSYDNYKKQIFYCEEYLDYGFNLGECINWQNAEKEQIPFSLMLGIKKKIPIALVEILGSENAIFASFFMPQKIEIKLKKIIPADLDLAQTITEYLTKK